MKILQIIEEDTWNPNFNEFFIDELTEEGLGRLIKNLMKKKETVNLVIVNE